MRTLVLAALIIAAPVGAGVIGRMTPPEPLTAARVASRPEWAAYLRRSEAAMMTDKAVLAAERGRGQPIPPPPRQATNGGDSLALSRDAAWYASPAARAVADTVVSFQTPAGGWGKNLDRTAPPRLPGQSWSGDDGWSYVGTLDNDATIDELRFLARVQAHAPGAAGDRYRASAIEGIAYLLQAQFPNGGWPQVYPLQGGYHDAMTLNDGAMVHATQLLQDVAAGRDDFAFVPAATRAAAGQGAARAVATLLAAQVPVRGRRTIWAQQYDPLTLAPVGARNFEPVALSSAESADVLKFLMAQPTPTPAMRAAIEAGVAWFREHALRDVEWTAPVPGVGRRLVAKPDTAPIWARFYDPATRRPIFGDRDRTIHDDVNDLIPERRNGYAWFNTSGTSVFAAHEKWRKRHG